MSTPRRTRGIHFTSDLAASQSFKIEKEWVWPMGRLVMKFGGTSVADIGRIRNVARHVKREVKAGNHVAVVVSAMAGTTDQLVDWCREAAAGA